LIEAKNLNIIVFKEPDTLDAEPRKSEETRFVGFCIFVNMKKF